MCWFHLNLLSQTFVTVRKIQRIMITNLCSFTVPVFLLRLKKLTFLSTDFRKILSINIYIYYSVFSRQHNQHLKYNITATCFDLLQSSSGWSKYRLNILQVLYCAFFIPYALHRVIMWSNLSTILFMYYKTRGVSEAICWLLFFHFVTYCRGGRRRGGFFLLFCSLAPLLVSVLTFDAVFILFSLSNCGIGYF